MHLGPLLPTFSLRVSLLGPTTGPEKIKQKTQYITPLQYNTFNLYVISNLIVRMNIYNIFLSGS